MADIGVPVAVEVAKCLQAPVGRHCGYVIFCDRRARELNDEIKKLVGTRDDVQSSINEARNDMKPIKPRVEEWVEKADAGTTNARQILENDGIATTTCFYGWLPNPKARYRLGNEASKMIKEIKDLIVQGQFERVYNENPPPGLVGGASDVNLSASDGGNTMLKSQASTFQDVMKALYDEKDKVIGVYGPGGVGKSTLLTEVEKKLRKEAKQKKEERPFHMIVKVEVSRSPDLCNIQGQIADALSLNLKDKETQQGRRDFLFQRLQRDPNEKFLIILDDLWGALDLEAVGIPLRNESMKCKLLLTSRDRTVLEQRMHADQTFRLKSLEEDEAFKLFEKIVGDKLRDDEELKVKAARVVIKLAGLPLLINSVASTLKCSDVSTWESMLIKVEDLNNERIVKWSYDHLESEDTKCLFLLCGLIGGTIKVELLLALGMGLGLFEGFNNTVQDSRNKLNTMLDSLHSFCLLQDGGDGKENVTIHDLYSDVVVSRAFSGQTSLMINNYGSWPKEKLEKCWACLVNVGSNRLAELMLRQFPRMKILMLSKQYDMRDCSRMDFVNMEELRALYLCSVHITSFPSSIKILGNLQSLIINCDVEDVANLGKLKTLQILSFARSRISKLPKEIGELTNLRSLNLSYCYHLEIIEPGALEGLINLEELYMKTSFNKWVHKHEIPGELRNAGLNRLSEGQMPIHISHDFYKDKCNARLVELKSLTKLTVLEISIPDPIKLSWVGDLPFGNLIKFWINIGGVWGSKFEGLRTMKLKIQGCDNILSEEWVQKTLQKTQYLHLDELLKFKKNAHELCIRGFPQLKHLEIKNSPSIEHIACSSNNLLTTFTILESLFLDNLISLEKICHGPIASECFNKLKAVSVTQCNQLKYLWCLSDRQGLVQLEEIEVHECNSMHSIVTHVVGEDIVCNNNRVELPNVRRLRLFKLPNMTSFCTKAKITSEDTSIQVSLPHLESLVMIGLLGLEKILYSEPSLKYINLKSLMIVDSKSTSKSIMKLDWILKLPNLEVIFVRCLSAEVVFELEELKVTEDVEILSRLAKLEFRQLPNLQRMWKRDVNLQGISIFRSLRELSIYETGLSFIFPVSMAKCLREIRHIKVEDCPNMKAVIVDEEGRDEGTDDIIEFPLLEQLSIIHCPMEKFFSYPHGKKEPATTTSDSQDANSDFFFDRKVSFPNITSLEISGLRCKELWNNQIPTDSFQKLEYLKLRECDNLQHIATSYMWKKLQCCLKELRVSSCRLIEIVYEGDDTVTESGKLRTLYLCDLKNLRHIWQSDGLSAVPFPKLRDVMVMSCSRLEMLFTTFTAKFLEQIEELRVESCEVMELIAGYEKLEHTTGTTITFSKLTTLRLYELPKFKSFLPEKYSLEFPCSEDFPSLRHLSVDRCGAKPSQVLGRWDTSQMMHFMMENLYRWRD